MSAQPRSISEWQQPVAKKVYESISAITGELAKVGIAKGRKNSQQNYAFRGIDDVYGALSSLLAEHKLCVIPRVLSRVVTERETRNGGVLFYVVVDVEFDLVSAEDGSKHTARTCGEAMDSGDKATNKAMSAAYKYFALQTFCIPTEGDNDTENHTHEIKPRGIQTDPRGDLGKDIPSLQAEATASQMLEILDEDIEDEMKLPKVGALHAFLRTQQSLYTAAGDKLKRLKGKNFPANPEVYWKALVHQSIQNMNGRA